MGDVESSLLDVLYGRSLAEHSDVDEVLEFLLGYDLEFSVDYYDEVFAVCDVMPLVCCPDSLSEAACED